MEPYNQSITSYMSEQLPDIINSYEDAVLTGDPEYSEYLSGIIQAYEHIVEKFPYEAS